MPKKLEDCVKQLMEDGYDEQSAYAICQSRLNKKEEDEEKEYKKAIAKPRTLGSNETD